MFKLIMPLVAVIFTISTTVWAHDGGHGPQVTDTGKYGGVLTAVVDSKDHSKGAHASMLYKAELTRSEEGVVRVYVYDQSLKLLPPDFFEKEGKAIVISKPSGKEIVSSFTLSLEGNAFVGKAPTPAAKPFNIEVTIKTKGRELIAAFENLD